MKVVKIIILVFTTVLLTESAIAGEDREVVHDCKRTESYASYPHRMDWILVELVPEKSKRYLYGDVCLYEYPWAHFKNINLRTLCNEHQESLNQEFGFSGNTQWTYSKSTYGSYCSTVLKVGTELAEINLTTPRTSHRPSGSG